MAREFTLSQFLYPTTKKTTNTWDNWGPFGKWIYILGYPKKINKQAEQMEAIVRASVHRKIG